VSGTAAILLVAAACLFGVGLLALLHRRDALGAVLAVVLGFDAVACALVGLARVSTTPAQAAQLQSFAVLVEITGALCAAAGISMAAVLRRRTGGSDLLELTPVGPRPAGGVDPGEEEPAGGADPGEQAPAEALSSAVAEAGNQEPAPELGEEG